MWDIRQVGAMFNDWFQIVKNHMPNEKNNEKFYDAVYDDCARFAEKYREGVSDADRWLVVAMTGVILNYEVRRLEGLKKGDELDMKEYLKKRLY